MSDPLQLLWGTVLLRPYVFAFLSVYLVTGSAHMGLRRTLLYIPIGYLLAWASEFASIHWGFPYGDYFYIPTTIDRELWIFGVPFMDSLSYVFLSYCSWSTAVFLLSPVVFPPSGGMIVLETRRIRRSPETLVLGACLFVLLDIIIDPVALQGHRWFLGQIYGYRQAGIYFGIPMSNFGGWLLVGLVLTAALQFIDRLGPGTGKDGAGAWSRLLRPLGPILYLSVLVFNLVVTFWIGEDLMGIVGCLIVAVFCLLAFFFTLYKHRNLPAEAVESHLSDFPDSAGVELPSSVSLKPAAAHNIGKKGVLESQ